MVPLWVTIAVLAAFLQNLRSSAQKRLTGELSTHGATAVRFVYGLPFAALWLAIVAAGGGDVDWPRPNARFVLFALAGSVAQVAATALLIATFAHRSFAVGTTYSKTEGMQTVVLGFLVLDDRVSAGGLAGVMLTVTGVLALSLSGGRSAPNTGAAAGAAPSAAAMRSAGTEPPPDARDRVRVVVLGLGSGALFAVSAVGYRGAALALGDGGFLLRAACTLVFALAVQSALTTARLALVEPGQLTRIARAWRWGLLAGATGAGASIGWFTAFTLTNAAYVKAVGSVELAFALASSWLLFGERPTRIELTGVALVALGVAVTVTLR